MIGKANKHTAFNKNDNDIRTIILSISNAFGRIQFAIFAFITALS